MMPNENGDELPIRDFKIEIEEEDEGTKLAREIMEEPQTVIMAHVSFTMDMRYPVEIQVGNWTFGENEISTKRDPNLSEAVDDEAVEPRQEPDPESGTA